MQDQYQITQQKKIVEEITVENAQNAQAQITVIKTYLKNHRYKRKKYGESLSFRKSKIQTIAKTRP